MDMLPLLLLLSLLVLDPKVLDTVDLDPEVLDTVVLDPEVLNTVLLDMMAVDIPDLMVLAMAPCTMDKETAEALWQF